MRRRAKVIPLGQVERSFIAPSLGLGGLTILLSLFAATLYAYAESPSNERMVRLPGSWQKELDLTGAEPAPVNHKIRCEILFAFQHQAEFDQLRRDLQNPYSPQFGHSLTPEECQQRFGVSRAQFNAVLDWIRSRGFTIQQVNYGRGLDSIWFTGTIGQAEQTFHVQIVWHKENGGYANTASPEIPARFRGIIGSISGLYNFPSPEMRVLR